MALSRSPQGRAVVVAMKKSIPGIPRRKRCLKKSVSGVATTGFEDFWKGGSEPMTVSENKL